AIRVHVVRESRRAPDPADEHDLFPLDAELRHQLLHSREDGEVGTAGAPPHLLIGDEVLFGQLHQRRAHQAISCSAASGLRRASDSMAERTSATWKGFPWILFRPIDSIPSCPRMCKRSWPVVSSGTSTLRWRETTSVRSLGSGKMCRRWTCPTRSPCWRASMTACVIDPYVPPQPIRRTSPSGSKYGSVGSSRSAMRRTFSARVRTIFS